jgi:hypothetical protein
MRSAFIGMILFACANVYGGEEASVLVSSAPAAAPVAVAGDCCNCANACNNCNACDTGRTARVRTRYRVVTEGCDACTGRPVRSVSRGVVRGTANVVEGVGAAAINVITLPARVCRNGRCN